MNNHLAATTTSGLGEGASAGLDVIEPMGWSLLVFLTAALSAEFFKLLSTRGGRFLAFRHNDAFPDRLVSGRPSVRAAINKVVMALDRLTTTGAEIGSDVKDRGEVLRELREALLALFPECAPLTSPAPGNARRSRASGTVS